MSGISSIKWLSTSAALLALLAACGEVPTRTASEMVVAPDKTAALVGPSEQNVDVGNPIKEFVVPFQLSKIPNPATLHLNFTMVQNGFCPLTYTPTTVRLNGQSLTNLDFRELSGDSDNDLRIPIPADRLRLGRNTLQIKTGKCRFAIDEMRINTLALMQ